ncbi:MAG: GAF domain-containing protein [Nanobdellota archaeon]
MIETGQNNSKVSEFADDFPVPIFKIDLNGNIFYINSVANKKLGYKKSEIMKLKIFDLFDSADHNQLKERISDRSSNRPICVSYEYTMIKKDGSFLPVVIHSRVSSNSSGVKYIIGSFFDISNRKISEEKLKESNEKIEALNSFNQSIINGISDELIVINASTRKIEFGNDVVLKRTGISSKQLKKKKCYEIYHPNDSSFNCPMKKVLNSGVKEDFEKEIYDSKNNLKHNLHIAVHPVKDHNNKVTRVVHIVKDITNKKNYEKRLKQLNQSLMNLYRTSSLLQKAITPEKICDIAFKTFESLGFDRIRIYNFSGTKLVGVSSNYMDDSEFKKVEIPVLKKHKKAYECIKYKKPVIKSTSGKKKIASFLDKPAGLESGSLPLISENSVVGMISFDNKTSGRKIIEEDLELYMTFANQIASAIQRSGFIKENQKKLTRLSTLYDIYSTISQTLDMEKIMNMVVIRIVKILKIDRCSIFLNDSSKNELIRLAVFDKKNIDPSIHKSIPMTGTISSRVLKLNKTTFVEDIQKSKYYKDKENAKERSLVSYLGVPLSLENKAIGVINCHTRVKHVFTENEIELLKALSSTASMMIENSRLYERIKFDKENFSELLEITQNIGKLHDINSLVKRVLDEAVSFTGADHGFVMLLNDNKLDLTFSAGTPPINPKNKSLKLGSGIAGLVAKTGKAHIIDDVRQDENYIGVDKNVLSSATIPLIKKGSVMGVLHLESSKKEKFKFYAKSLGVLTNHIAVTIENIRLYNQVLNFNKELESKVDEATKELKEKNKELKKMDELKTDFVSNVSHELRTPLTSIIGYAKLLSMGKLGELTAQQSKVISTIVSESERLSRLINDVLDLSKLESGKVNINFEKVDAGQVIKESVESLMTLANSKDLKLSKRLGDDLVMSSSHDFLKQAIINLLSNAIKFTKNGGKVNIFAKKKGNYMYIKVKDTGVGIPEEEIPKLFDKFYQIDSSMTREHSGTGLGLMIVKHIVDLHGGKIEVDSKVGKGSTFSIKLPVDN